jgi:hypothetical protein
MKKILFSVFILSATTAFLETKSWYGQEHKNQKNDDWFGKEPGAPGVELSINYINNETNIKNSSKVFAQSLQQRITLGDNTHLTYILHRTKDNNLILEGWITKNNVDFRFKSRLHCPTMSKWHPYFQQLNFTYEKWTISLSPYWSSLGLISVRSLVYNPYKDHYKQRYNIELLIKKNQLCGDSVEKQVEMHSYPNNVDLHTVKLDALKANKKIKVKYLLSNGQNFEEFARIKVFDPDNKVTNLNQNVFLETETSYETIAAKMVFE